MIWKQIGKQIEQKRKQRGWSMQDLGDRVGMSRQNINDLEKGRTPCSLNRLDEIANALGYELTINFR